MADELAGLGERFEELGVDGAGGGYGGESAVYGDEVLEVRGSELFEEAGAVG